MVSQFIIDSLGADSPTVKRLQEQERQQQANPNREPSLSPFGGRSEAGSSYTSITTGGATNKVTGQVSAKSGDTIALESLQKELNFNKVKQEVSEEDAAKLRVERRKAATASADFQRRGQALEIEGRQAGIGRELAGLRRSARQVQAQVLSQSAGMGNMKSSSAKAAQLAAGSNLNRETAYVAETEDRASRADKMREEQIAAGLSAALLSETDPTKVIQDAVGNIFVNGVQRKATEAAASLPKEAGAVTAQQAQETWRGMTTKAGKTQYTVLGSNTMHTAESVARLDTTRSKYITKNW